MDDGLFVRIGPPAEATTFYLFVRESTGRRTELVDGGVAGLDRAEIRYAPDTPARLSNVVVAPADGRPGVPATAGDRTFGSGDDVYIKWNAGHETGRLAANPISLWYTTDDQTFQLIAENLVNSTNGDCVADHPATSADDGSSGCYLWEAGAPSSGYFSVRVAARSTGGSVSMATSVPMNTPDLEILAGHTYEGTGASAATASFSNVRDRREHFLGDRNSLVVAPDGTVFFRDIERGILRVDPVDQVQQVFIPTTGVARGDGGPVTDAELRFPLFIALDYQNRLWIQDFDIIRRVDLGTGQIDHVIGGGSNRSETVADPLTLDIYNSSIANYQYDPGGVFFALPNGDFYFSSDCGYDCVERGLRVFRADSGTIESIRPTGVGDFRLPDQDLSLCPVSHFGVAFDPLTGDIEHAQVNVVHSPYEAGCDSLGWSSAFSTLDLATFVSRGPHPPNLFESDGPNPYPDGQVGNVATSHVGRDGNLYRYTGAHGTVYRYDRTENEWVRILGSLVLGSCADGTLATNCDTRLDDIYVTAESHLYFMDGGRLRTLDREGRVRTLMGVPFDASGGSALDARFHTIRSIGARPDGPVVVLDAGLAQFAEFERNGAIEVIAGNGRVAWQDPDTEAVDEPLVANHWYRVDAFEVDPMNGNIFYPTEDGRNYILELVRSSGRWQALVGGGGVDYRSAEGLGGSEMDFESADYLPAIVAFDPVAGEVLAGMIRTTRDYSWLYRFSRSDGTARQLLGGTATRRSDDGYCPDGTPLLSCDGPASRGVRPHIRGSYDTNDGAPRWILGLEGDPDLRVANVGGTMETLVRLENRPGSFAFRRTESDGEWVYYCEEGGGRLVAVDLAGPSESALAWGVDSIRCTGSTLIYDSVRNSLVFPFTRGPSYGVAEYQLE